MLTPRSRRLLLEALRPPPGHSLSRAIGTSYTLDLMALLTAPLAFTFFDHEDDDGRPIADPLALLQAVRSNADRIHIFCQAGGIAVPSSGRTLLSYLEDSVFEVTAPKEGGVFHPKIWVIRFVSEREEPRYRLLCLTRNLTFDRSWDTALVLDGQFQGTSRVVRNNAPLSSFLGQLPSLALRPVPAAISEGVQAMSEEVGRVRFELPDGFESYRFWPLGLDTKRQWPFPDPEYARRFLVCSPFLSDSFLAKISASRPPSVLISRPESLLRLGQDTRANFSDFYVLSPEADPEEEDSGNADSGAEDGVRSDPADGEELTGLHAKLFVMDDGWNARIWTGSANATDAAFHHNVEFLIELTGKKSFCGIDKLLGNEGGSEASLRDLLQPFHLPDDLEPSDEEALGQLERLLSRTQLALARSGITASVSMSGDDYTVSLSRDGDPVPIPEGMEVRVRPITLPPHWAELLLRHDRVIAEFPKLSFDALTSFFAFELTLKMAGQELKKGFVLNLAVSGMPADRRERLLQSILKSSQDFLRLILLLLSDVDITASQWAEVIAHRRPDASAGAFVGFPLLETLLKALDRDPTKLDDVSRLVEDLRRTPEGSELIPKGFDSIWDPIWAVRQEMLDG